MKVFNNVTYAFEKLFSTIMTSGEEYAGTKAVFNESFTVRNISDKAVTTPVRKFKEDYAKFEWDWYLSGDRNATEIADRAKIWKQMMVPGTDGEVNSNYGYFWNKNGQLDRIVEELKTNPSTRRAILVHYDISELDRYKYDTPCNVVLNFYIKGGKLHLTVFARSIDLVYGFCNDYYTFASLMELVSQKTGYKLGDMHWFITNIHIYPRHFELFTKK
jgi:thymidylate synthase